ncbi:hypothetical protein B0H13DRAFT_1887532 [Mycena leptocephala]|nr:hypothetical protein B0H13DRAFT_1887532 [Mycena leptocephala]
MVKRLKEIGHLPVLKRGFPLHIDDPQGLMRPMGLGNLRGRMRIKCAPQFWSISAHVASDVSSFKGSAGVGTPRGPVHLHAPSLHPHPLTVQAPKGGTMRMAPCGYGNSRTAGCGLWDADDRDHQAFGWEVPGSRLSDSARFFHAEVIERQRQLEWHDSVWAAFGGAAWQYYDPYVASKEGAGKSRCGILESLEYRRFKEHQSTVTDAKSVEIWHTFRGRENWRCGWVDESIWFVRQYGMGIKSA